MKRPLIIGATVLAVALLSGCDSNPDQGKVIDKTYRPSDTIVSTGFAPNGGGVVVTTTHVSECHGLVLENGEEVWQECVSQREWLLTDVGDEWSRPE